MQAIITVGISGSGKTTWAEKWCDDHPSYVNINRDDIRWGIMEGKGIEPSWKNWDTKWENYVTRCVHRAIVDAWVEGNDIVISDTNLDVKRGDELVDILTAYDYDVKTLLFPIELDEAVARDQLREHSVGARVIEKQYEK